MTAEPLRARGLSPFLTGRMFVREPSWEYSANLVSSLLGELLLREPSWEYSSNCDDAIFGVQKASLNIVQELCESRGGRPELSVLTSLLVSVDVKNY